MKSLEGAVFVFTGFRDKDAEQEIVAQGGKICSGINKTATHLVVKDKFSKSVKMQKAREMDLTILSPEELDELLIRN